jgi:hypothetical protein
MLSLRTLAACFAVALLAGGAGPQRREPAEASQLRLGMTPAEVRQTLGPPNHVARQILYHRYLEQWIYNAPRSMRVEFDCPRGRPASLLSATSEDNNR